MTDLEQEQQAAQFLKEVAIGGEMCERVPYGSEVAYQGLTLRANCRDCAVRLGWLHIPGCCVEACPRCKTGQAFGCPCSSAVNDEGFDA